MKLKDYDFPQVNKLDVAFSTFNTIPELLEEAKKRGFLHGDTPYNKLFSKLFFMGGKVEFKRRVDRELQEKAWPYCCALMGSFEPKHEHKEAVCAMIMSELLKP